MADNCVIPGCLNKRLKYDAYCTSYHATYDEDCSHAIKCGLSLSGGQWGPPWPAELNPDLSATFTNADWRVLFARPLSPDLTDILERASEVSRRIHTCCTSENAPETNSLQELIDPLRTTSSNDIDGLQVSFIKQKKSAHSMRNQLEFETRPKEDKHLRSQSSAIISTQSGRQEGLTFNSKKKRVEKRPLNLTTRKFKKPVQSQLPNTFFQLK